MTLANRVVSTESVAAMAVRRNTGATASWMVCPMSAIAPKRCRVPVLAPMSSRLYHAHRQRGLSKRSRLSRRGPSRLRKRTLSWTPPHGWRDCSVGHGRQATCVWRSFVCCARWIFGCWPGEPTRNAVRRALGQDVNAIGFDFRDLAGYSAAVRGMRGLFLRRHCRSRTSARPSTCSSIARWRRGWSMWPSCRSMAPTDSAGSPTMPSRSTCWRGASPPSRPGFFAQNLGDAYLADIRDDCRLYVPAGSGASRSSTSGTSRSSRRGASRKRGCEGAPSP